MGTKDLNPIPSIGFPHPIINHSKIESFAAFILLREDYSPKRPPDKWKLVDLWSSLVVHTLQEIYQINL